MTHARLVEMAERWLRRSRCGIVLSEQGCSSGEMPDAIGWKGKNHSIVIECKISRADFLADADMIATNREEREDIVEQALVLMEQLYVHLPLKRAMHAIDPVQRLKLLVRSRVKCEGGTSARVAIPGLA